MTKLTIFTFVLTIFLFVSCILCCNIQDTKYVNQTAHLVGVEPSNAEVKHTVGGSVKITSGCQFVIKNLTIIPTGNAVYWYAYPIVGNNTGTMPFSKKPDVLSRVVLAALGSYNGQTAQFALDPQYSFNDIAIIVMWSEGDNRPYGAFDVNGKVEDFFKKDSSDNINFENPFTSLSVKNFNFFYSGSFYLICVAISMLFM